MADIKYIVNQDFPEDIEGFEQYSQEDRNLLDSFQINSTFNPDKNYSELHILSLSDELLESDYLYNRYTQLGNAQSAGQEGASILTIDPIADSKYYGYDGGGIKLLYHFLDDLYTDNNTSREFFIQDISPDRTEVVLNSLNITQDEVVSYTSAIKNKLDNQSYFAGFRLNFKENDLIIATNIDTIDSGTQKLIAVKLYEPLPDIYDLKSTLTVVEIISDSIAYEVDSEFIIEPEQLPTLRSANFNIEIADESVIPTAYQNYNELFSYPVSNANNEVYSAINEKGIKVNVDYTDFNEFVHFSSAEERLLNFKYKVDLLSSYSASISSSQAATTGLQGVSGSRVYYEGLITGVVSNFDHYERFLYYESGSGCWPKSNTTKPYINKASNTPEAITWFATQRSQATYYDQTNFNSLINSIPTYLRDDANNDAYLTFIYMVGQHFDNLWLYAKAVTDKYDGDNRPDKGISKDLVGEALKNFGVKLYTSNKSIQDLFSTFVGQAYQSGSEKINNYITGSLTGSNTPIQPTSYDDYQKEVQKRMYHNLPLLLKSKGTERGLRALINCFGIPADILDIKLYGGKNTTQLPFFGNSQYVTSSLGKIRLDNTGSIISGNTLSSHTSIIKRDKKYTDDLHAIEIGFSPTDNIDAYIVSKSAATFNLDDYLGDPRSLYSDNYSGLYRTANTLLSSSLGTSSSYDLQDYVRLIKFFDNTVFKMVNDFIPARSNADVGVIIKPNILNISKAKSVIISGSKPEYTGSIDTAFISSQNASIYKSATAEATTAYTDIIQTPTGVNNLDTLHGQEQAKYNGELSKSLIVASTRELNKNNPYKTLSYIDNTYDIVFVSASDAVCVLDPNTEPGETVYISPGRTYVATDFFSNTGLRTAYSASNGGTVLPPSPTYTGISLETPYSFTGLQQYDYFYIKGDEWNVVDGCSKVITARYGTCALGLTPTGTEIASVKPYTTGDPKEYDITTWFSKDPNQTELQYTASYGGNDYGIPNPGSYRFTQASDTQVTITVKDVRLGVTCQASKIVTVNTFTIGVLAPPNIYGHEFAYSYNYGYQESSRSYLGPTTVQSVNFTNTLLFGVRFSYANVPTKGVQGYFTPFDKVNLLSNSNLLYNIYELRKDNNGNYNLRLPLTNKDILPRKDYSITLTGGSTTRTCAASAGVPPNGDLTGPASAGRSSRTVDGYDTLSFCETYNNRTPDTVYDNSGTTPLTVETPSRNSQWYYKDISSNLLNLVLISGQPNPVNTLIQAYVIEVYDKNSSKDIYGRYTKRQQVEVYGQYYVLAEQKAITSVNFVPTWILVGWDYATQGDPGTPGTPPDGYGPWIQVNIRKLTLNGGTVI